MQIDQVSTLPGIFRPALIYSIVAADDGIYLICTGRGMGPRTGGGVAGAIAGAVLDKVADKRAIAIAEQEAKIRAHGPAALVATKYSQFVPRASIKRIAIEGGEPPRGWPVVVIEAAKKVKLHFQAHEPQAVRQFFAPFST